MPAAGLTNEINRDRSREVCPKCPIENFVDDMAAIQEALRNLRADVAASERRTDGLPSIVTQMRISRRFETADRGIQMQGSTT